MSRSSAEHGAVTFEEGPHEKALMRFSRIGEGETSMYNMQMQTMKSHFSFEKSVQFAQLHYRGY